MLYFSQYICDILHQKGLYAGGVQVHIRTSSLSVKEFSHTFSDSTNSSLVFAKRGFELFLKNYTFGEPLRSLGLRAINIKDSKSAVQQDIFGSENDDILQEQIEDSIFNVRKKFGQSSIKRGTNIKNNT